MEDAAQASDAVRAASSPVALSTASVYPESTAAAFESAAQLGYDGIEIMVGIDPASQSTEEVRRLSDEHGMPVLAIHAPCLLITQRVFSTDPWEKLRRSAAMAAELGAATVVVHPPFRWQRDYARGFVEGIAELEQQTGTVFAVENMFPWRASRRELQAYLPSWDPVGQPYANVTLDVSHAATSGSDVLQMAADLGPRLHHLHAADGTGSAKDEHLVPGRGKQPCAELLERLASNGFGGCVVVEINTRRAAGHLSRQADLAESLAFVRLHLVSADSGGVSPAR